MSEPGPTRWIWVRHAPVVGHDGRLYGASDVPCDVSERPAFEALAAAMPADALLVTSHLGRARDTAAAILDAGWETASVTIEKDLGEQSFGDWQGHSWAEIEASSGAEYEEFWNDPCAKAPPGGESFTAVIDRVAGVVERLNGQHAGRHIVAVAHGGSIRAAIAVALGIEPVGAMGIQIDNLSMTGLDHIAEGILRGRGGHWRVVAINRPPR